MIEREVIVMWKKMIVAVVIFIGTFSIAYGYYNWNMSAQTIPSDITPFALTPRDGTAGSRGTQFVIGTYEGEDTVWESLINHDNLSYIIPYEPLDAVQWWEATRPQPLDQLENTYDQSNFKKVIDKWNDTPRTDLENKALINHIAPAKMQDYEMIKDDGTLGMNANHRKMYATSIPNSTEIDDGPISMRAITLLLNSLNGSGWYNLLILKDGLMPKGTLAANIRLPLYFFSVVPYMEIDLSKVTFAVDRDYTNGLYNTNDITSSTITLLRVVEESMSQPVIKSIRNNTLDSILTDNEVIIGEGHLITVNYQPVNVGGTKYLSVLYRDRTNKIDYYERITNDPSKTSFDIDSSKWKVGIYDIYLVIEDLTEKIHAIPSSPLSDPVHIEVVDHYTITYKSTPKDDLSEYKYAVNAKANDKIGEIHTVAPLPDELPITYHLESNGDDSYQNFEIIGLGSQSESSASTLDINIKSNAKDLHEGNLKAGEYKFCINTQNVIGEPTTPTTKSKVCTSFTVEKTDLTIAFTDPNETVKSVQEATTVWEEEITYVPNAKDVKVKYSKSGGDIHLIDIDADSGSITYKGNGSYGKVKIKATADDDPSTGMDNYNSSFVEKEIVIYREVDGVLTPDSASSDINIPTFSMDKPNIKTGGIIGVIKGTLGTPDIIGGSTTTYSYTIKQDSNDDGSMFQVNASTGVIKANANLGVDTYNFIIIVSDKWSFKEIPVTVNVGMAPAENLKFYENASSNTMISQKSVKITDTNVSVYATVKGSSNSNPVTYRLKDGESTNVIDVNPNSGAVTLKNVGTVVIVAEKQGANGQANAIAELTFTITAGSQEFIYTDSGGNELPKSGNGYIDYAEVYAKGKTFQLYTSVGSTRSTMNVTYALQAGSPTDVISVDSGGLVTILNASIDTQIGQVIVEATSHDPNGNYSDKTIELPITITKAEQTISFKNVTPAQSGQGKVTPIILAQDISSNEGGVSVSDTDYYISVDASANGVAWTNNGIDIEYNYSGETGIEIALHVEKAGNRNYNKTEADGKMRILSPDESNLSINQPGKIYYGDHFTLRSLQDDSSSTNVQYTFEVDNTIFVSNPSVNGNKADFDALKCSDGSKINITVTRTADGEATLSKIVTIEVLPKDIKVIIDDKQKKKGDENPPLTFQDFTSQLVSWNGIQDVVNLDDVALSTTATKESKAGSYPITGNTKEMNTTYPNYNFIFKEGKLMVDTKIDKDVDGDGKPDFNDPDGDGCPDLNIKWKDDHGDWVVINGDRDYDGIPDLNIDSDGDGVPDLNIDTDNDGKPDINLVILKKSDWKPTKCVTVNSTVKEEYCTGTSVKPQINIDTNGDNIPNINIDNNGDMKPDLNISKDGKTPSVNIVDIHEWKPKHDYTQGSFQYDSIGTDPDEPKRETNIDTDGDGRPDVNIDFDGDGKPDINIDMDGDEIPDIDIDTNGDGKPDINIDTDGDGKADENLYEIDEWKPNKDGEKDGLPFDTIEIERKPDLEDNGIKVEKPDGTPFLPNFALKVEDVTDTKQSEITEDAKEFIEETQEVKKVYDVKLFKDDVEVQLDGTLKIKIPYEGIKNPILIRKNANGSYEKINYTIENGYLIYETDELGIVSIIGNKEFETSVQGTYTPNIGGALTGDETNIYLNLSMVLGSLTILIYLKRNKQKDTFQ